MGRLLLLLIVVAAVVAVAIALFQGDTPLPSPGGEPTDRDAAEINRTRDPGAIDAEPGILVTAVGRVVRMGSREPMAKVKVTIGDSEALSEADGAFSLLEVPAGEVEIHLTAPDLPPHVTRLTLRESDPDLGEIALPADTVFSGQVSGPGNAPVSGAAVRILERTQVKVGTWWSGPRAEQLQVGAALLDEGEPAPGLTTATDDEGRFRVEGLSPGEYYFDVVAAGFAHSPGEDVEIVDGGQVERTVVLAEGGAIRGQVLDARRQGVGSARVMALPWNQAVEVPYAPILGTTSGPDGAFELPGLVLGDEYLILARAPDGKIGLGIRVGTPSDDVEIRVGPRFALKGTVVDDESGAAIPGASLFAILGETRSDENGSYLLEGVVRSPFFRYVWISAEGYEDKQHEFDLAGSLLGRPVIEEDFRLTKIRPATLRVTARDLDGNVLVGVALLVSEWGEDTPVARGVTRGTGEAVLTGIPPSARRVRAIKPGYVLVEVHSPASGERMGNPVEAVWVNLEPGGDTALEITLARTAEVRGRVVDDAGKPLAGVMIYSGSDDACHTTNEEGFFLAEGLPEGVTMGLNFLREGYLDTVATVVPGSGNEVEVVMKRGAVVSGRVVDRDGAPLPGVSVTATGGESPDVQIGATSSSDGGFSIPGLGAGRYILLASRDGFAPQKSAAIDLRLGEVRDGLRIVLEKGVNVTVVAVLGDGTEVPAGAVVYGPLSRPAPERMTHRRARRGDEPMEFRLLPGLYRVLATPLSGDTGAGAVEVELTLDRDGPVRLTLSEGGVGIVLAVTVREGQQVYGMALERTDPPEPAVSFWFRPGEDGVLRSPPLPAGRYSVTAYARSADGSLEGKQVADLSPSAKPVVVDLTK